VTHFVSQYGIGVVVALVFLEAAGGAIVPGESAFIIASALAGDGHGDIVRIVIATAASAIAGTIAAYAFARIRGFDSTRPWFRRSEAFFHARGAAALFVGRFVPVLRTTLGWMAGLSGVGVARFLLWNVAGCITWACAVGSAAYYLGEAVVHDAAVGVGVVAAVAAVLVGLHLVRRRRPERA
jgi:membrane-associated protein